MKVLGIESSCDETACAIVEDGKTIISNVVATQIPFHQIYKGVVPEIASRKHAEWILPVVRQSLEEAKLSLDDVDAIAATNRPGLMGSLLYFGYYYRVYIGSTWKDNILPVVALNLILGFVIPGIDYLGHIGGLIGGILASMAVGLKYKEPTRHRINGTIIYLILFVFLLYLGIFMK